MRNLYALKFYAYTGCSPAPEEGETREDARAEAAARIRAARADGRPVATLRRGAEWEFQEREGARMIGDDVGTLEILPPAQVACFACGFDYVPEEFPGHVARGGRHYGSCPDCSNDDDDDGADLETADDETADDDGADLETTTADDGRSDGRS